MCIPLWTQMSQFISHPIKIQQTAVVASGMATHLMYSLIPWERGWLDVVCMTVFQTNKMHCYSVFFIPTDSLLSTPTKFQCEVFTKSRWAFIEVYDGWLGSCIPTTFRTCRVSVGFLCTGVQFSNAKTLVASLSIKGLVLYKGSLVVTAWWHNVAKEW